MDGQGNPRGDGGEPAQTDQGHDSERPAEASGLAGVIAMYRMLSVRDKWVAFAALIAMAASAAWLVVYVIWSIRSRGAIPTLYAFLLSVLLLLAVVLVSRWKDGDGHKVVQITIWLCLTLGGVVVLLLTASEVWGVLQFAASICGPVAVLVWVIRRLIRPLAEQLAKLGERWGISQPAYSWRK